VTSLAFNSTGEQLLVGGGDVRVWDVDRAEERLLARGHFSAVESVAFQPGGVLLACGDASAAIKIWDLRTGEDVFEFEGHEGRVAGLSWSPDGRQLAAGGYGQVWIWDLQAEEPRTVSGHSSMVNAVAWSPDGSLLASGAGHDEGGPAVRVVDAASGEPLQTLLGHHGPVSSVAFSPDGQRLASASWDGTVRLWDVGSGELLTALEGHTDRVNCLAWSPDGKTIASGSGTDIRHVQAAASREGQLDFSIRFWDAGSGEEIAVRDHSDAVRSIAFSQGGRRLASAAADGGVRLWNLDRRTAFIELLDHDDTFGLEEAGTTKLAVAFSSDGRHVV
jgi:WD40 repeat protein